MAGGAGLLGAALATALTREGHGVVAADDFGDSGDGRAVKEWRAEALERLPGVRIERVDLTHPKALSDLFARHRPAAALNAALFDPDGPGAGPLLRAAQGAGIGLFVHLSDGALYAPGPAPERPAREDEPLDAGDDPALKAKLEEERLLEALGLPAVCLRVFDVVGPMFPPRRFPVEALEAILADEEAFHEESGWHDFVHVEDVAKAVLKAISARPLGRTLNVGGGLLVNPRTFLALLARKAGRELRLTVLPPGGPLRPRRVGNLAAAREVLGWVPFHTLDGIASSLVSARTGTGAALRAPHRSPGSGDEPRPVSRRELFDLFRRPFGRRGR